MSKQVEELSNSMSAAAVEDPPIKYDLEDLGGGSWRATFYIPALNVARAASGEILTRSARPFACPPASAHFQNVLF